MVKSVKRVEEIKIDKINKPLPGLLVHWRTMPVATGIPELLFFFFFFFFFSF